MTYWIDLFTGETWREFLAAGSNISGFREKQWKAAQRVRSGDIFLCYLTGISRWIGVLEVTGAPYRDSAPIWSKNVFPVRFPVNLLNKLEPITAVPVIDMRGSLSIFQNLKSPHAWTGRFRGSLSKWTDEDGQAVVAAINEASAHPIERQFDASKLRKVPPILKASAAGAVTIPENEEVAEIETAEANSDSVGTPPEMAELKETSAHTEIQWLLLKLGNDMGMDVWVAKNDRNKSNHGVSFNSFSRLKTSLPHQFDEATNRTIELIDVLWLKGNSIQAAFEIESTTSIYSGLLRMSDLITMQPNLNIPLYIVAPVERRDKVVSEINRPTFAKLSPPMAELCRFISFEELRRQLNAVSNVLQYLKPEFLDSFSEGCQIEDV